MLFHSLVLGPMKELRPTLAGCSSAAWIIDLE